MIEKILNIAFYVHELQCRTNDPLINEYRGYQWRMLVFGLGALFFMLMGWWVSPAEPVENMSHSATLIVAEFSKHAQSAMDLLVVVCCVVCLVNTAQLVIFCQKYES